MLEVVSPVLQVFPTAELEVSTTLEPWQNVTGPLADMVGVTMGMFSTATGAEVAWHPFASVVVTVTLAVVVMVAAIVVCPVFHK
jgi:hypothetical protein